MLQLHLEEKATRLEVALFYIACVLLVTLFVTLFSLVCQAATPATLAPTPAAATEADYFTRTIDNVDLVLEMLTALQVTIWEQRQLGRIDDEQWRASVYLAEQVRDAVFAAIVAAYERLSERASSGTAPKGLSELDYLSMTFSHYAEFAFNLIPKQEVPPWLRERSQNPR